MLHALNHLSSAPSYSPLALEGPQAVQKDSTPYTFSRPELVPPDKVQRTSNIEWRLLAASGELNQLSKSILSTYSVRVDGVKERVKAISAEQIQKLKEAAERASSSNFWSTLSKIATSLLSAFSVIFGVSLISSGASVLVGGAMLVSGILSLTSFALSECGAWDYIAKQIAQDNEDYERRLKIFLPAAVGILAGAVGLVGSVHSVASGSVSFAAKAVFLAEAALTIFGAVTGFGKGVADARLLFSKADLAEIEAKLTVNQTFFDNLSKEIEGSLREFGAIKSRIKKSLQNSMRSTTQLIRN
ncbi:MAG: hypothetical protein JSS61_04030 [Verrucomicrobia bacterium]|nr:hypothetical protein [Verrucomicrobiota bacterium]